MTYARDPYDTDQPPCMCGNGYNGETTPEFCPYCGDPSKPAPEPPDDLPCDCAYCCDSRAGL